MQIVLQSGHEIVRGLNRLPYTEHGLIPGHKYVTLLTALQIADCTAYSTSYILLNNVATIQNMSKKSFFKVFFSILANYKDSLALLLNLTYNSLITPF